MSRKFRSMEEGQKAVEQVLGMKTRLEVEYRDKDGNPMGVKLHLITPTGIEWGSVNMFVPTIGPNDDGNACAYGGMTFPDGGRILHQAFMNAGLGEEG